jgi:hypothetical protein
MFRITGLVVLLLAGCGGSDVGDQFSFEECRVAMVVFYGQGHNCTFLYSDGSEMPLPYAITTFCTDMNAVSLPGRGCTSCRDEFENWYACFARPKTTSCVECNVLFDVLYNCKCSA